MGNTTQAYKCIDCNQRQEVATKMTGGVSGNYGEGWSKRSVTQGRKCKCGGKMYVYIWQDYATIEEFDDHFSVSRPPWFSLKEGAFVIDSSSNLAKDERIFDKNVFLR
mmetsp:Transcript_55420/g.63326  ORF Transcript_55420/g.63326 Transcript_55420/m.63326 type:complete len:108 (+) Transcript_55420:56-379(+)